MKKLQAGDIIQEGDIVERHVAYTQGNPKHEHHDTKQHPVQPYTIGRVILPADLMTANYYRP